MLPWGEDGAEEFSSKLNASLTLPLFDDGLWTSSASATSMLSSYKVDDDICK